MRVKEIMTKEDKSKIAWLKHIEVFQHEYKQLNERYINEISHCGKLGVQLVEMKVRLNSCNEERMQYKKELENNSEELIKLKQQVKLLQSYKESYLDLTQEYQKLKNKNWFQRLFNL